MNKFSVQCITKTIILVLSVGIITTSFVHPRVAFAATNQPVGLTISPITQNIQLPHTQPQIGTEVSVTNNTPGTVTLKARVVDFASLDETGGILFAGSQESSLTAKFGLFKWTALDKPDLTLAAGETQTEHVVVNNSGELSPGGHYGAVLFQLNGTAVQGGRQISLNQVVSSLLFVSKHGGDRYDLHLQRPAGGVFWATLPGRVTLRFFAGGNEYMIPRGTVTVADPFGKVAARGVINESSNIILPQTHRRYPVELSRSVSSLLPGRYTVTVLYRYDGENSFSKLTYGFWVVNVEGIVILLLLITTVVVIYLKRRPVGYRLGRALTSLVKFLSRAG